MEKELKALENELSILKQQKDNLLRKQARAKTDNETKYWQFRIDKFNEKIENFENIKSALTELKQIKEAKPSEALESLQKVSETYYTEELSYEDNEVVCKNLNIVEQALLKAQEQEKVLEIIKGKNVDIVAIKFYTFNRNYENKIALKMYNSNVNKEQELTQEEFDTLKRWCENEKEKTI